MGLFSGSRPGNLGAVNGMLARCKTSPNCVSSQTDRQQDPGHYIEPLQTGSDPHLTWSALRRLLADTLRVNTTLIGLHLRSTHLCRDIRAACAVLGALVR